MPAINFPEYARRIGDVLHAFVASGDAARVTVRVDQRSSLRGFIAGSLLFNDESELYFRELVDTTLADPKLMYAYHYQNAEKEFVFRYDNAAHRPPLARAQHRHTPTSVEFAPAPTMQEIVDEILRLRR